MTLEMLLANLSHPDPQERVQSAQILGVVEETRAQEAIRECYQTESHPQVKTALNWAGQRIHDARRTGYQTIDELFRRFHLERLIRPNHPVSHNPHLHRQQLYAIAFGRHTGFIDRMAANRWAEYLYKSGFGHSHVEPKHLSHVSAQSLLEHWWQETDSPKRIRLCQALVALNNPTVLGDLAEFYWLEYSPQVRLALEETAKTIYLTSLYWQLKDAGILEEVVQLRLENLQEYGLLAASV